MTSRKQAFENLIAEAAQWFGVTKDEIMGRSRRTEIVRARHAVMYCCRTNLWMGYREIARAMNRSDHSTVIHAEQRIRDEIQTYPDTTAAIAALTASIEAPA